MMCLYKLSSYHALELGREVWSARMPSVNLEGIYSSTHRPVPSRAKFCGGKLRATYR